MNVKKFLLFFAANIDVKIKVRDRFVFFFSVAMGFLKTNESNSQSFQNLLKSRKGIIYKILKAY